MFLKGIFSFFILMMLLSGQCFAAIRIYDVSKMGLKPDSDRNASPVMKRIISRIRHEYVAGDSVVLRFAPGKYHFYEKGASIREYYISNHDQDNPRKVGIPLEGLSHFTMDGCGAELLFHGRMLPLALVKGQNCTLQDFSIDFAVPHISQIQIVENKGAQGIVFRTSPEVRYTVTDDRQFEVQGEGWTNRPRAGIAFEEKTGHVVYNTGDIACPLQHVEELQDGVLYAPEWKDKRLPKGTAVALRTWQRPAPGIFLSENKDTEVRNVKVFYAEGMGLLAQVCENVTLDGFCVCLNAGASCRRYFTTQADATHFSGCKGVIKSVHGLYEGMMDDAINVHGTYLKVMKRIDDRTLVGRYMHHQSWGFKWGDAGDSVQFVRSATMDLLDEGNRLVSLRPYDCGQVQGAKEFILVFERPLPSEINGNEGFGIENITWAPSVVFKDNIIRNNRARGALFSTPKPVVVENNLFDHTSGTAILLCGDCNGWYETGACRNVRICHNKFINALTSIYQFTEAIISIYPEIPDLQHQKNYFHGGKTGSIVIENNVFDTFDRPVLYAKSVRGLLFRNNVIRKNMSYPPFHENCNVFKLERTDDVLIF